MAQASQELTPNSLGNDGEKRTIQVATGISIALSAVIVAFLFWLIYFRPGGEKLEGAARFLPELIAACNALATVFIINGIVQIKAGRKKAHAMSMVIALSCSALFLVLYIVKYNLVGDSKYQGEGLLRLSYLIILISHIILSIVMLPMILMTVFFSATRRFSAHKALARWTYPIWIYVSITGVAVYVYLNFLQAPAA